MASGQRRRGAALGYLNIIVKNVVNLLYTPMLLSFVGQGDYGVFQTANSFVYSLSLLSFGLSGAYVRFYTQRKAAGDLRGVRSLNGMYLGLYLIICCVAIALGLFCAFNVRTFFSRSFTSGEVGLAGTLMVIMTFNVAITLLSTVFDAYVIVHEQFTFQQTRQMLTTLATPGLALVFLRLGLGAVGVSLAQLSVNVVLLVLNIRFSVGRLSMRFDFSSFDLSLLVELAAFSGWLFANQLCDLVNQNVPNVVLGARCSATVVAVLAVSIQIRNVFISLSTTLSNVFVPKVNRIVADSDDNSELTRLMTRVGRYQMILLMWVLGGFAVLGRFFIARWAGASFSDAYWLVLAMGAPLCVPLSQNIGIEIQKAKDLHRARSVVYLFMALVNVVFTWLFAPALGYWAAAIAYIGSIVIGNCLFMNWYYQNRVGLNMMYYWKNVSPVIFCSAAATIVSFVITRMLPVVDWGRFLLLGAAFTCMYSLALWGFALDNEDRTMVKQRLTTAVHKGNHD